MCDLERETEKEMILKNEWNHIVQLTDKQNNHRACPSSPLYPHIALHLALGQFYKDDIVVEPAQVIPLLATALLLQMDPLIDQCTSIMMETINLQVRKGS